MADTATEAPAAPPASNPEAPAKDVSPPAATEGKDGATNGTTNGSAPAKAVDVDTSKPQDFDGEVATTGELPSAELLRKVDDCEVLDRDGKAHTFKSLYEGPDASKRVLVVFVRHFFCGLCQMYLASLSESITPEALQQLPASTSIVVIGCGDPGLIPMYATETACKFPIYTDPKRKLFDAFGMVKTLDAGKKRPTYQKLGMLRSSWDSIVLGLKQLPSGLAHKSGDPRQVGGEFLFESKAADATGEKEVTWCHRMRTTRDHTDVPELMAILGLDAEGKPIEDVEKWKKAVAEGKANRIASQKKEVQA